MTTTATLGLLSGCASIEDDPPLVIDTGLIPPNVDTSSGSDTSSPVDTQSNVDTGTPIDTSTSVDTGDLPEESCRPTVGSSEGPYWVEGVPVRTEFDLYGHAGTSLTMSGKVVDMSCTPIADAVVEIWHARPTTITIDQLNESTAVEYDNTSEEREYRGQMNTDADGRYQFHTLKPGWYMNGGPYSGTYRPSHIHIKIWIDGVEKLTTQLYFKGDPLLEDDPWAKRSLVLEVNEDSSGAQTATFDFVIATDG